MDQTSRYHPSLMALHWAMALLITAALVLGAFVLVKIPDTDPMKLEALRSHMGGGILILILMLVRLFVRMRTRHPAPATAGNPLLDRMAWASHRLIYVAVFGMAGSGLFMAVQAGLFGIVFGGHGSLPPDFWVFPVRTVHYAFSRLLMALIVIHVVAALFHALVLKDGLLRRMLPDAAVWRRTPPHSRQRQENSTRLSKVSPWLSRLIVLAVAALFMMISLKFVLDPQGSAVASGLSITLPVGSTNARAGFGGFPLGFALILIFCLFSTRRLLPALASIAVVAGVILMVRLYGAQMDGTFAQSVHLLAPEGALLLFAGLGVLMEKRRLAPRVT